MNTLTQYITNKYRSVVLPNEPGLLEWLQKNYPYSKYTLVKETTK